MYLYDYKFGECGLYFVFDNHLRIRRIENWLMWELVHTKSGLYGGMERKKTCFFFIINFKKSHTKPCLGNARDTKTVLKSAEVR